MRIDGWITVGIAILMGGVCMASEVALAPDRISVVDGNRVFVLGLYENPADDAVLKQVAEAGFNLVHAAADAAALDRLHNRGLHAWINTGANIDFSSDRERREADLRKMASTCGAHPALLAWEVPDEALWNCWYGPVEWRTGNEPKQQLEKIGALPDAALAAQLRAQRAEADRLFKRGDFAESERLADEIWRKLGVDSPSPGLNVSQSRERAEKMCAGMREGYALLKQIDPHHPVWMNHAPRNQQDQLAAFDAAADIVGCDIYPVPEYLAGHSGTGDRSLATVGAHTTLMQNPAPGKPAWMVLQGFGWSDLEKNATAESKEKNRRPTFSESRFMAYDSIVRGARGILYWGTAYIEKDSTLWKDLLKLVRELADLQPVLSAPDVALRVEVAPSWGTGSWTVQALGKNVAGKTWFIVVNESGDPLNYSLHVPAALEGIGYADREDAREAVVRDGKLMLGIQGHGVQVLRPAE